MLVFHIRFQGVSYKIEEILINSVPGASINIGHLEYIYI